MCINKTWSFSAVSVKQLNAFMGRVRAASRDAAKEVESALSATINVNEKTPAASKSIVVSNATYVTWAPKLKLESVAFRIGVLVVIHSDLHV